MKRKSGQKNKVLVALSGGIDSAVSAYLLIRAGYEVEAAFMKNWSLTEGLLKSECPWLADRQEALRVAAFLKIPLYTLDFERQYQDTVMEYFFREYEAGRTPNPDVMCNKEIKFKLLYNWAMEHGFDYLATGHYARIVKSEKLKVKSDNTPRNFEFLTLHFQLERSVDEFKDQTYFIYNIKPEQLPHLLFPIGEMKKAEVKKLAAKIGLPNASRQESMGLCFVGKIRLKDFLEQKLKPKPGPIIDQHGNAIGQHEGLHNYTIGQRQGIKVGASGPYFVVRKDLNDNTLYVTNDPDDKALQVLDITLHSLNWIAQPEAIAYKLEAKSWQLAGRFRHQGDLVPLTIEQKDGGTYLVHFKTPQKSIASGQSLVLYDGKICVGGGIIA